MKVVGKIKAKFKDGAMCACGHCGSAFKFNKYETTHYNGKPICEECYQDFYGYCDKCGKFDKYDNMDLNGLGCGVLCAECYQKAFEENAVPFEDLKVGCEFRPIDTEDLITKIDYVIDTKGNYWNSINLTTSSLDFVADNHLCVVNK